MFLLKLRINKILDSFPVSGPMATLQILIYEVIERCHEFVQASFVTIHDEFHAQHGVALIDSQLTSRVFSD